VWWWEVSGGAVSGGVGEWMEEVRCRRWYRVRRRWAGVKREATAGCGGSEVSEVWSGGLAGPCLA